MKFLASYVRSIAATAQRSVFATQASPPIPSLYLLAALPLLWVGSGSAFAAETFTSQEVTAAMAIQLAMQEWGPTARVERSVPYFDLAGVPFATGFHFVGDEDTTTFGTIVMSNINGTPPLIEIVAGTSLHDDAVSEWLETESSDSGTAIDRLIYYPFLPLTLVLSDSKDGRKLYSGRRILPADYVTASSVGASLSALHPYPRLDGHDVLSDPIDDLDKRVKANKSLKLHELNVRGDWRGCTPAAAANIFGYFDDVGLRFLPSGDSMTASRADVNALLSGVAQALQTTSFSWQSDSSGKLICEGIEGGGSTKLADICEGLRAVASAHSYDAKCELIMQPKFRHVRDAIAKNLPVMLSGERSICNQLPRDLRPVCETIFRPSIYKQHSVAALGYKQSAISRSVVLQDGWPAAEFCGTSGRDVPRTVDWDWFLWFGGAKPLALNKVTPTLYGSMGCPGQSPALFFEMPFAPNGSNLSTKANGRDYNDTPLYFKVTGSHDSETGSVSLDIAIFSDSTYSTHVRTDRCQGRLSARDPAFADSSCELIRDTSAGCRPIWLDMTWRSASAATRDIVMQPAETSTLLGFSQ